MCNFVSTKTLKRVMSTRTLGDPRGGFNLLGTVRAAAYPTEETFGLLV
jgi:hypothetical protein